MQEQSPSETTGERLVSRGAVKLAHAIEAFDIDPTGWTCADFGANAGGFTQCLIQCGAGKVYALDTGYGVLDWSLRKLDQVIAMERTNVMHAEVPTDERIDLVVVDLGWTPQRHAVPAALRWIKPASTDRPSGKIITLIKPHYELTEAEKHSLLHDGVLDDSESERVAMRTIDSMTGAKVLSITESPIRGGGTKNKGTGNREWLALLEPDA